jgi:hypothetical protein
MSDNPSITIDDIAEKLGINKRNTEKTSRR